MRMILFKDKYKNYMSLNSILNLRNTIKSAILNIRLVLARLFLRKYSRNELFQKNSRQYYLTINFVK